MKLVSARSTPAPKAPSVSEKPMRWVSSEAPVTLSRHSATNVSSLRLSATSSKILKGVAAHHTEKG